MPLSDLQDDELATAIGYLVVNSARFESALDRSLALLIHGPQWRPVTDMGLEGLRMLEEFPDPASIQILVSRAPVSRRVTILFDLVERWWPASTDDADVQKAKREITSDVAMRNLLAHGYQRDREFHLGRGDAQKFTPTQVLRVAERLHRKAYTLEGLVYTWLGRAPMPAQ